MFCPKCGEIVRDTAIRCPNCKASLRGGRTKVNKNCDHRHAQPDTVESSGSWQNPSQWDKPQSQARIFGQPISEEKLRAFRESFTVRGTPPPTAEDVAGKTEEIIGLLRRFFSQYKDFSGRTSRREFWITNAIIFFATLLLSILAPAFGVLVSLGFLIPSVAMGVRRLHDTGKDGKAMLVGLFPYFGFVVLLVWYCQPSAPSNQWGPKPLR